MAADHLVLLQHAIDRAYGRAQQWRAGYSLAPRRISESVRATDTVKACEESRQCLLSGSQQAYAKVPVGEHGIVCLRLFVDADEQARGVRADRGDGARRQSATALVHPCGDDGDTARKISHGVTEFGRFNMREMGEVSAYRVRAVARPRY